MQILRFFLQTILNKYGIEVEVRSLFDKTVNKNIAHFLKVASKGTNGYSLFVSLIEANTIITSGFLTAYVSGKRVTVATDTN